MNIFADPTLNAIVEHELRRGNSFRVQETSNHDGKQIQVVLEKAIDRVGVNQLLHDNRRTVSWHFDCPHTFCVSARNTANNCVDSISCTMPINYGGNDVLEKLVPKKVWRFVSKEIQHGNPIIGIDDTDWCFRIGLRNCFSPPFGLRIPLIGKLVAKVNKMEWVEQNGPWVGFESGVCLVSDDEYPFIVSCAGSSH